MTRPMKAEELEDKDLDRLLFPVIASPKYDGIRAMLVGGSLRSSTFKLIPNEHIREHLERELPEGADGEIVVGKVFQEVTSGVMSVGGVPDFKFWMFDLVNGENLEEPYVSRLVRMDIWRHKAFAPHVHSVPTRLIQTLDALLQYELEMANAGYEGVMVRKLDGPYKCGRSTLRQGWLLKRKPFADSEARVVGFEERLTNTNELQTNELGLAKRSSAKAGKVPMGTLGKFICEDVHGLFPGVAINIGTGRGLTNELRLKVWQHQRAYLGKLVKYKFQKMGSQLAPRLPIFLGFRDPEDMVDD